MSNPPSIQLYTVRNAIGADLPGTVARLAGIGYTRVEPYDFVSNADQYARAFADAGVSAPSGHSAVIDTADVDRVFDAAEQLGINAVIDPFVPSARWLTVDDVVRTAERVNELAHQASERGLRFGYHNHQWEFANIIEGRPAFAHFVDRLSDDVILEIDTFWSTVGGAQTPALLRSLGDRVKFLHIKDGVTAGDIATALPSEESALDVPDALAVAYKEQVPAGRGQVDVSSILAAAPHAIRVVEFDDYKLDIFDGVAQSLAWLKENDK